jgi:phosphohistidine phosphatase
MARQLLLMRHAKSAWDTDASTDFERPLAKRGKGDAPRMGKWILDQDLVPDHIVCSPAQRAKQTLSKVCKSLELNKDKVIWDPRIYGAGTEDLLDVLAEIPSKSSRVLLIGHNPGLEFLLSFLAKRKGDFNPDYCHIKTATLVALNMPNNWKTLESGCAKLVLVQHPRELPQPQD